MIRLFIVPASVLGSLTLVLVETCWERASHSAF